MTPELNEVTGKEILKRLLCFSFLTGSRAFGTNRDDSDYDIVYPIYFEDSIKEIIKGRTTNQSNYFSGYTILVDGLLINLIPVHPHDFLPWYLATKAIKETLITSGLNENPTKKYSVFMGIVSLFKGTVEELKTVSKYRKQAFKIIAKENKS